eukprot:CAMPEP_0117470768 /NCGR_PEP_ID=MMETSP0784-20121206/7386_1 /TAXON_ID=39447 /ORGANISM="" /LENGTH=79 /DNA_ID=CAMNT_0005264867 /DNA_START=472 /DNA_END=711 /DNA_ORIENTATION=-
MDKTGGSVITTTVANCTRLGTAAEQLALYKKNGDQDHIKCHRRNALFPQHEAADPKMVLGKEAFRNAMRAQGGVLPSTA